MATTPTKIEDVPAKAADVVTDAVKATETAVKAQTAAVAKVAEDAAAPVAKAVEAAAKPAKPVKTPVAAPAKVAKPVVKTVKAKAAPVRKAVVKAVKPVTPAPIKKAAKAVVTAAAKVAKPASKEWTLMATKFETPKMLTDLNDRAKESFEKSQKLAAEMTDFSKGNVEAMVESTRIAAKGAESIFKYSTDYGRSTVEAATATAKKFASVKSPTEFFQLQGDVTKSVVDAMVTETAKFTENYLKLVSEATQPLSNRFALAAEKIKAAA